MFSRHLGALALAAALVAPLAASAQTAPVAPPAAAPAATPAAGAPAPHRHHHRGGGFRKALGDLNLTDAQKQQIAGIMKTNRANMKNAPAADPATRRANMQALRGQIDAVLTPPQRAQFQANLAKNRQSNGNHAPAPMASPQ